MLAGVQSVDWRARIAFGDLGVELGHQRQRHRGIRRGEDEIDGGLGPRCGHGKMPSWA